MSSWSNLLSGCLQSFFAYSILVTKHEQPLSTVEFEPRLKAQNLNRLQGWEAVTSIRSIPWACMKTWFPWNRIKFWTLYSCNLFSNKVPKGLFDHLFNTWSIESKQTDSALLFLVLTNLFSLNAWKTSQKLVPMYFSELLTCLFQV